MRFLKWIKKILCYIFSKESLIVGLMVLWRWLWRTVLYGGIIFGIIFGIAELAGARRSLDIASAGMNILMLVVWQFVLNSVGKIIARKRYQKEIQRFIGWSIFWREVVYRALFILMCYGIYLLLQSFMPVLGILFFVIFILIAVYIAISTYGYATRRAIEIYAGVLMSKDGSAQ